MEEAIKPWKLGDKPFGIIYRAINKTNGKSYVGKTKNSLIKRKSSHKNNSLCYNYLFMNTIRKYGIDGFDWLIIEEVFGGEKELKEREDYWISYLRVREKNIGYNLVGGIEDNTDWQKLRKKSKNLQINKKISGNKGKKSSYINPNRKAIKCIDTGVIYGCAKEASKALGINELTIYNIGRKRCRKSIKGYPDFEFLNPTFPKQIKEQRNKISKYVKCLETGIVYNTISEAAKANNIKNDTIARICNGETKNPKGLHWKFVKSDEEKGKEIIKIFIKPSKAKKVKCIETGIIYDSCLIVEKILNLNKTNVRFVANGKGHTCGGFHWEWAEEKYKKSKLKHKKNMESIRDSISGVIYNSISEAAKETGQKYTKIYGSCRHSLRGKSRWQYVNPKIPQKSLDSNPAKEYS